MEYCETLKAAGFVQGKTSPCLFFHKGENVTVMLHGDDFVAVCDPDFLESTKVALSNNNKIKTEVLGSAAADAKDVRILNKMVRMTDAGIEQVADPRHAELVIRDLGFETCRPSRVPGAKATKEKV